MATLSHTCENCSTKFKIVYDEETCDSDPQVCPFCSEFILNVEDGIDPSMDDELDA